MKRIAIFILLAASSFVWSSPARAQIFRGPDSDRKAEKAGEKYRKAQKKALKKQVKAMKKYQKAQRKAARKAQRGHA